MKALYALAAAATVALSLAAPAQALSIYVPDTPSVGYTPQPFPQPYPMPRPLPYPYPQPFPQPDVVCMALTCPTLPSAPVYGPFGR